MPIGFNGPICMVFQLEIPGSMGGGVLVFCFMKLFTMSNPTYFFLGFTAYAR